MKFKSKLSRASFAIPLLVVLFSFGFTPSLMAPVDNYFEISKNLDIFGKLYREVNAYYVDEVDPNKFMRSGIDEMLGSLDPYTNFISASEIEDYRFMSTGQYGGIGAVVSKVDGKVLITEPYEGYPAAKAGLRAGDEIIQIDEEIINKEKFETLDVRDLLRGQAQTSVNIIVKRMGTENPLSFDVERDEIKIKNVPYFGMVDDKTGYISLTGFTRDASGEVKKAYESLKADNPNLAGLILDLRGNPGGLLYEAVSISNLFVNQGSLIVETRGKIEGSAQSYTAKNLPIDNEIPLAVLINRRSASASEIVSGVMQDLDRGVIIGQRSFGKGLVQTTRPLSYNTQLKITTAKYYTPSGRCIQAIDYANRNEDGSVGKFADSLKKEFKTVNGRSVYDGGGVEPDLYVEPDEFHTVTKELARQNLIFDFATKYHSEHETIPGPREFEITDEIYKDFTAYVRAQEFKFDTKTENELDKLVELLKEEHYFDELESELEAIEGKLAGEKKEDLDNFRSEISQVLKTEIVTRYFYRSGVIEASFDFDEDVREAISVLKDKEKMDKILAKTQ